MSSTNSLHHTVHSPYTEKRDPIMEDDHFSLRYGNPIKVIHDIQKHKIDTFEPTQNHVPAALAEVVADSLQKDKTQQKPPLLKSNSSYLRDSTICSEFYHNKNGSVAEVERYEDKK
jgi:hypothetical protein